MSKPIDILTAISNQEEPCDTSPAASILPNLQALHLFRYSVGSIFERADDGQNLVHFLQHRADLGIPIKTIVCTAEDAATIALDQPEALSLVDTVESGVLTAGIWDESLFPNRLIPLLEENLD